MYCWYCEGIDHNNSRPPAKNLSFVGAVLWTLFCQEKPLEFRRTYAAACFLPSSANRNHLKHSRSYTQLPSLSPGIKLISKHAPAQLHVIFNLLLSRGTTLTSFSYAAVCSSSATWNHLSTFPSTQLTVLNLPLPRGASWTIFLLCSCLFFLTFLFQVGSLEFSFYAAVCSYLPSSAMCDHLNIPSYKQVPALLSYLPSSATIWTFILQRSCLFFLTFLCHEGPSLSSSIAAACSC